MCKWDPQEPCHREPCDPCQFREPSTTEEILGNAWEAFVCVLIVLPVIFFFEYLWMRWVRAPVREKDRFWDKGDSPVAALAAPGLDPDDARGVKAVAVAGAHLLTNLGQLREDAVVGADLHEALAAGSLSRLGSETALAEWRGAARNPTRRFLDIASLDGRKLDGSKFSPDAH